jgi:hypothetical protein
MLCVKKKIFKYIAIISFIEKIGLIDNRYNWPIIPVKYKKDN